jgi:hypothetical protein
MCIRDSIAASAKEAANATQELKDLIAWSKETAISLADRDQEMVAEMQKSSLSIQTALTDLQNRASILLDRLTGAENAKKEAGDV